jgi:hypothetical protein
MESYSSEKKMQVRELTNFVTNGKVERYTAEALLALQEVSYEKCLISLLRSSSYT